MHSVEMQIYATVLHMSVSINIGSDKCSGCVRQPSESKQACRLCAPDPWP